MLTEVYKAVFNNIGLEPKGIAGIVIYLHSSTPIYPISNQLPLSFSLFSSSTIILPPFNLYVMCIFFSSVSFITFSGVTAITKKYHYLES